MRVLVTRPHDDAAETAAKLKALGHEVLIAPLLEIQFRAGAELALDGVQAVLITSANGIRALARRTNRRDVDILGVGAQSAETARQLGFACVNHADGDAEALANLAIATLKPENGALFHAAGAETRGRLAETLQAQGFDVRSETLYDAVAARALPSTAQAALAQGAIDAALFFSPRTAQIFAEIVAREGLAESCRALSAVCISRAAADALQSLSFRAVQTASHPDQAALLALLKT
jgi:uroporphyrinogen-III synthase